MIRDKIAKDLDHDPNFRWRGEAVTRIENLSDIVFALALGMLISSANPPQTFSDLNGFLFSIIPVTAAFAVLVGIWHQHFTFFRRYGVADGRIIFYNGVLLFVVLYLAYPLRFAFDSFFAFMVSLTGDYGRLADMGLLNFKTSGLLLGYFGAGYAIIYALYALMYQHALKKAHVLALTASELQITRQSVFSNWFMVALSSFMAVLAYATPLNGMAGFVLAFSGVGYIWAGRKYPLKDD